MMSSRWQFMVQVIREVVNSGTSELWGNKMLDVVGNHFFIDSYPISHPTAVNISLL